MLTSYKKLVYMQEFCILMIQGERTQETEEVCTLLCIWQLRQQTT